MISIAPVDGQYLPADQRAPLHDFNYLVFHGSHDGDVTSFHGLRIFNRVQFSAGAGSGAGSDADAGMFKSAVYVYRANHGQWNTVWAPTTTGLAVPASWSWTACSRPRTSASSAASSSRPSWTSP